MQQSFHISATCESEGRDLRTTLKAIRIRNINKAIIAHISITSIRNKIDFSAKGGQGNINIIMVSETKTDDRFPMSQFATPFRFDQSDQREGIFLHTGEDFCSQLLKATYFEDLAECLRIEINLRQTK